MFELGEQTLRECFRVLYLVVIVYNYIEYIKTLWFKWYPKIPINSWLSYIFC